MSVDFFKNKSDKLICESCGEEFFCGVKVGKCWCFEIDLNKKTLAKFRENYENCLCEKCLLNRETDK